MVEERLRRLVPVALVAVVVAGCGGAASSPGDRSAPEPAHHWPEPDPWEDPGSDPWRDPVTQDPWRDPGLGDPWPEEPASRPTPDPYPDVTFEDPGTNPFVDPRDDSESTFAMDVDTASYDIGQRFLDDGYLPDPASIRVEEWINRFDLGYPAPDETTFGIHVDGGPTPFTASQRSQLVRIGIRSRDVADRDRPDAMLTFVVDVSGSMAREGRLEVVKGSLELLVRELRDSDRVALVVYGDDARVVLNPTAGEDRHRILDAIRSLRPEGSTNFEAGLRLGYALARDALREGGINRVVLASDGVANVGATDPGQLLDAIRRDRRAGIELVTVGVGMGNYDDVLMERLADDGDGRYAYVETREDAERLFVDGLVGTLLTVAEEAKVQVAWDPEVVEEYRLLGFENRRLRDDDFTDDRVDAGEVGAGHSVTALYEVRLARGVDGEPVRLGEVRLRWREASTGRIEELTRPVRASDLAERWRAAVPEFRLAATVAAFAEVLGHSPYAGGIGLWDLREEAHDLARTFDGDPQVLELEELIERAAELGR